MGVEFTRGEEKMYEELMEDKEFLERVEAAEDLEAIQKLFEEKGYEIDLDALQSAIAFKEGELSENDLEEVAGGVGINMNAVGKKVLDILKQGAEIIINALKPKPQLPIKQPSLGGSIGKKNGRGGIRGGIIKK